MWAMWEGLAKGSDGGRVLRLVAPAARLPYARWRSRATAFARYAADQLWAPGGKPALDYLRDCCGLKDKTIRRWRLGFNPATVREDALAWGLLGDAVACPRGLVFPVWRGDEAWAVRVRQPLVGDALAAAIGLGGFAGDQGLLFDQSVSDGGPCFVEVRGGQPALYGADTLRGRPVLLLARDELDALLLWQSAADLADVAALSYPLASLDDADALAVAGVATACLTYPGEAACLTSLAGRIVTCLPPDGGVQGLRQAGGSVRTWAKQALQSAQN